MTKLIFKKLFFHINMGDILCISSSISTLMYYQLYSSILDCNITSKRYFGDMLFYILINKHRFIYQRIPNLQGQNFFELCNNLQNFRVKRYLTSRAKKIKKKITRITTQVAEQSGIIQKSRKYKENVGIAWRQSLVPVSLPDLIFFVIPVKNYAKPDVKVFCTLLQKYCRSHLETSIFLSFL